MGGLISDTNPAWRRHSRSGSERLIHRDLQSVPGWVSTSTAVASVVTANQAEAPTNLVNNLSVALPAIPSGTPKVGAPATALDACFSIFKTATTGPPNFSFTVYYDTLRDPYEGATDLIVSEKSQLAFSVSSQPFNLGTTADETIGLAHSHIPLPFNLTIPGALDAGPNTPVSNLGLVIALLNASSSSGVFLP